MISLFKILTELLIENNIEKNILKTTYTKPIVNAIKEKRKITFSYYGPRKPEKARVRPGRRIKVEPYAIGLSKKGNLILRAWVEPPSVSKRGFEHTNWRTFLISRIKNIEILGEFFDGNRPGFKQGNDGSMSTTYISLSKIKNKVTNKDTDKNTKDKNIDKNKDIKDTDKDTKDDKTVQPT